MEEMDNQSLPEKSSQDESVVFINGMYKDWFLDYASYVILERAVPAVLDGTKPVQRRILHAMKELDDGRYNKVANIIGSTMQYHPHGDASIGDAIVNLGQKDLLIDCQGNWGDIRTGDSAAAPRYIEARLSKFALEVAFNPETTEWQLSYDGRKKEPVNLPMKFPLLLAQGADGIAVGLSTKVLPHNFIELIDASIAYLKKKPFTLYPDFLTGGMVDCRNYNDGKRGGKIRVRAKIEIKDRKTLAITEIPYSATTTSLIESILKANDKGKIKIKKVVDNTAKDVEILIELQPNVSTSVTVDALYAFTDCEVSISPNTCVIVEDKPMFLGASDVLKICTDSTVHLLKRELEIKLHALQEKWHFSSLEKIFIENRIYRDIEECETWESVIETIDKGLDLFKHLLFREVTEDDIIRLTEIKIKRISKFDSFRADELIKQLETDIAEVKHHLEHLIEYAIDYFKNLKDKYGKGRERKTEITAFDQVEVKQVAANNEKLYVDRKEGFIGYGKDMKKEEYIMDCSDIDDIIVFLKSGVYQVTTVKDKVFVGKDILYVSVWNRGDERMVYNAIYLDGKSGVTYSKRFNVQGVTRDKEYDITTGTPRSKLFYFSANPNGEAETVNVLLSQGCKAKKKNFEYDFSTLDIKGKSSRGNQVTKYPVRRIDLKSAGVSTLGGLDIYLDETVGRLNKDERGRYLGNFEGEDLILVIFNTGEYMLTNFELTNRYEMKDIVLIEKFDAEKVITAIHFYPSKKCNYVKRFQIETSTLDQRFSFITDEPKAELVFATTALEPVVKYNLSSKDKTTSAEEVALEEIVDVKGWKAVGNKLVAGQIKKIELIGQKLVEEEVEEDENVESALSDDITTEKDKQVTENPSVPTETKENIESHIEVKEVDEFELTEEIARRRKEAQAKTKKEDKPLDNIDENGQTSLF
ncbi:MAG: DNA gyrase/topoisomerase IV subunit A [Chitinophagales bacterium]|nr:DNA gyrase/topoisomerase IV subunit A [Chitinophagales bacterium]